MPPNELPAHTSASQLGCYASCPKKYMYRYVEHVEAEYRSTGLALGSAVHGAVAWWFDERVAEREPGVDDAIKVLHADLDAALAYPNVRWKKDTSASLHAEAERLLRVFLAEYGELPVVETERHFDMLIVDPDTGEIMPRGLVGVFDLELADGRIIELKTARKSYSETDVRTSLQFCAYRTAQRLFAPYDVSIIALIRNKTPRIQRVDLPADRETAEWFMRTAAAIERGIATGVYPPAPSAMCSSCEYQRRCFGREAADEEVEDEAA